MSYIDINEFLNRLVPAGADEEDLLIPLRAIKLAIEQCGAKEKSQAFVPSGKWVMDELHIDGWVNDELYIDGMARTVVPRCNHCGLHADCMSLFCPNCGAKMTETPTQFMTSMGGAER